MSELLLNELMSGVNKLACRAVAELPADLSTRLANEMFRLEIDTGDIMLVSLSEYTIGMRAGMGIESSAHVGFSKNRMTYRLLLRFDGGSGWDQPFQPEFSAPTQSPFIQLAAR